MNFCPINMNPSKYVKFLKKHHFEIGNPVLAGGVLCPQPGCGAGILPDNPGERKIKCVQCSYVFCKNCHQGRVSVQGVESLWGDCRFIPADWGSQ